MIAEVVLFRSLLHINAARKVTAVHLMRGSSFSLDIFESPTLSHIYEARPYQWSFLEGHSSCWNRHLRHTHHIRGGVPPPTTIHSFLANETLNWDLQQLFAPPRSIQWPRTRLKPNPWLWTLIPTDSMNSKCIVYLTSIWERNPWSIYY